MNRLGFAVVVVLINSLLYADDPVPFLLQSAEDKFASAASSAEAAIAKAEAEAAKSRKAAAEVRLKAYKDRLAEVIKTGDFDKAVAVKARIEQLEKEPEGEPIKPPKRPRPKETARFQGHTYALIKENVTWHIAKQRCEEMGGHLVILDDSRELPFVLELCKKHGSAAWIGATDEETEGKWKWVNGSDAHFSGPHISNTRGSEHFIALDPSVGDYNDVGADRLVFVCEWDR